MSRDAITTPPKKIAGFKHNRITSSDGTDQETYALLWQDGIKDAGRTSPMDVGTSWKRTEANLTESIATHTWSANGDGAASTDAALVG